MSMNDRDILNILIGKLGVSPRRVEFDQQDRLLWLDLSSLNLSQLPSEIGYLTSLQTLRLDNNQLTHVVN